MYKRIYKKKNERDKIAKEICKNCSYRNKVEQLETKEKKLIEKLEEDIGKFNQDKKVFMTQSSQINASLISYIKEILEILKGEKE